METVSSNVFSRNQPQYDDYFMGILKTKWITVFLQQVFVKLAALLSLHWGLKVIFNYVGRFTGLPLGSPVVGFTGLPLGSPVVVLPPFSLWTGVFCSISSADDRTDRRDSVPRASLVRAGEDGVWVGEVSLPLATNNFIWKRNLDP
jgi:hypothetical protein